MKAEHRSTAIIVAVLMVPFGVAIYKDANATKDPYGLGAVDPYGYDDYGDYDYEPNDYYNEDFDRSLEEYEELNQAAILAELAELERLADEPKSMDPSFFDDIFFDDGKANAPGLSGPLGQIRWGATEESLTPHDWEEWELLGVPGHTDAYASLNFESNGLSSVEFTFPDDGTALRVFNAQWGPAQTGDDDYQSSYLWFNESTKVQAEFLRNDWDSESSLRLSRYQDLQALIAPDAKLFGFEDKDLTTLSESEFDEMDEYDYDEVVVSLPQVRGSRTETQLLISADDGKVTSLEVELVLNQPDSKRLLKLLEQKLGRAKKSGDEWSTLYTFSKGKRRVQLSTEDSGWNAISVRPR